jgi:cell division protease FtsH
MHRMALALLERETLDKAEIDLLIEGKELPPFKSPLAHADPGQGDGGQKVLKPEGGRKPGYGEGQPSPA